MTATLLRFLASLSLRAYVVTGTVVVALGAGLWVRHWHVDALDTARRETRDSIATAAALALPAQRETVFVATVRTDTQWLRTQRTITRVDTLIRLVPESVLVTFPDVDSALRQCTTLARDCEQLRADLVTERTARATLDRLAAAITIAARDSLAVEQARPKRTWQSNTVIATVAAVVGALLSFLAGR